MSDTRSNPKYSLRTLREILGEVGAEEDEFVLFGSMPMYFLGIRNKVGDIDVFVRPAVYRLLRNTGKLDERRPDKNDPPFLVYDKAKPQIHFFYDWTKRSHTMDIERCFRDAQRSEDGWPFAPLTEVAKWKVEAQREKDVEDLDLINEYWERLEIIDNEW